MHVFKTLSLLSLIITPFVLLSCSQTEVYDGGTTPKTDHPYLRKTTRDSLTFKWSCSPDCEDELENFEVLYKVHGSGSKWTLLGTAPASDKKLLIRRTDLPPADSVFEFSVRSVYKNGENSRYVQSSEYQETFKSGWILNWK